MVVPVRLLHLARRFFGSLRPGPPSVENRAWATEHLTAAERAIWDRMSNPDKRHSIEVARAVDDAVAERDRLVGGGAGLAVTAGGIETGNGADRGLAWPSVTETGFSSATERRRTMVAAALMHDSGKNESRLGTLARVGATVIRPLVPEPRRAAWLSGRGVRRRLARYWRHPALGAAALEVAGSHELVRSWAAQHHRPPARWTVHPELGRILRDCDND